MNRETMASLHSFLVEVTQELLYNIVYDVCNNSDCNEGIQFCQLSEKFELKFGHRPTRFFGCNDNDQKWVGFLKSSPGLQFHKDYVTICDNSVLYKKYNTTKMRLQDNQDEKISITVAYYREILIDKACKLISPETEAKTDAFGNTPLHLIASLPCMDHKSTLVKHLVDAGFEVMKKNNNGQTILHIIAGRMQANVCKTENDELDVDCETLENSKFDGSTWPADARINPIIHLSEMLSIDSLTVLSNIPDKFGNTAMHEWVLSLSSITSHGLQLGVGEADKEIGLKLQSFGANLRQQNNSGEIPLHFAYNSEVFQFLLDKSVPNVALACCRTRNEHEETPFLRILKYATERVCNAEGEEANIQIAVFMLRELERIAKNEHVLKAALLRDKGGNSAVDVILITLKNTPQSSSDPGSTSLFTWFFNLLGMSSQEKNGTISELRKILISLLKRLVCATEDAVTNSRLLFELISVDDAELLPIVEILVKNNADVVNTIDHEGRTPLDVVSESKSNYFAECKKLFLRYGAKSGSSSRPLINHQKKNVNGEIRKLVSCSTASTKHQHRAQQLIGNNENVAVVKDIYRYSSEHPIGLGAFSSIFVSIKDETMDDKTGEIPCRLFALKRMEKTKMNSNEFQRECKTLRSLSGTCEHIIDYHDSFKDENFFYLWLDLMDGDLTKFVADKKSNEVPKDLAIDVIKQIISGLEYLHTQELIHCDLKPENILYRTEPVLNFKIADFGLAKNMSGSTVSTIGNSVAKIPGTRCWMAPELVSMKSSKHTKQSDIFSLGLVFHYLLTLGKHPFATENEEREPEHVIEKRIVDSQIQLDYSLDCEARSFLQELLNQDPSLRKTAQDIHRHLFLWTDRKKLDFLIAIGAQKEAYKPSDFPNSKLERELQMTNTGKIIQERPWDQEFRDILKEMGTKKKYRTDKLIDLLRFIRNAYEHKDEKSLSVQDTLNENVFFHAYPDIVLDVFGVVKDLGLLDDETRSRIKDFLIAL